MKLTDLATLNQVIDAKRDEPGFREEWIHRLARDVAIRVIQFRAARTPLNPTLPGWSECSSQSLRAWNAGRTRPPWQRWPRSPPARASSSR